MSGQKWQELQELENKRLTTSGVLQLIDPRTTNKETDSYIKDKTHTLMDVKQRAGP